MTTCRIDIIELDDEAYWADEHSWSPRREQVEPSVLGSLLVDESRVTDGRPITLSNVCVDLATLQALRALADTEDGGPHTLTLPDGRTYSVEWRTNEGAITPVPNKRRPDFSVAPDALFFCDLRFRTVSL